MYERIPTKKPGDPLYAAEVNVLGETANRINHARPGTYMSGLRSSINCDRGMPPWYQCLVEVIETPEDWVDGCLACAVRYYDHAESSWSTDTEKPLPLDAESVGLDLQTGDRLAAWWDEQRGAMIPMSGGSSQYQVRSFTLRTELTVGGYAIAQWTRYKTFGTCGDEVSSESSASSASSVSSMSESSQSASSESSASSMSVSSKSSSSSGAGDRKFLCFAKDDEGEDVFFIVYDRLGEFSGWADEESQTYSCGIAWKLSDTPTFDELCLDPFAEPYEDVRDVWEIKRMTCTNFYGCPCQIPGQDPCAEDQE